MRNVMLIARREYLERVRTKAFIVMTFIFPFMMLGLTILPGLLASGVLSNSSKHLAVVASDSKTGELIAGPLRDSQRAVRQKVQSSFSRGKSTATGSFVVDVDTDTSDKERAVLAEKVRLKQLDGVVWASDEALAAGKIDLISHDASSAMSNEEIKDSIRNSMRHVALKKKGLGDDEIKNALDPVKFNVVDEAGNAAKNGFLKIAGAFVMVYMMFFVVLRYGINVMRSVLEEKTSRIMEVMLASARAEEMMGGKILGVGAVGLTQLAIWFGSGALLSSTALIAGNAELKGIVTLQMVLGFLVFFPLGYVLYSTIYAAIGAMMNSEQESQQISIVVLLPLIFSTMIMFPVVSNPGSGLAFWASIFPLTAPMIMYARITVQMPPAWQVVLSIGLLILTIYGLVLLCARIYRVGILMYGKKPTLPEILKWIKYA